MSKKIGRNEKCPCGSEQKYKKCCLENDEKKYREITITKKNFISKPYKKCPNQECLKKDTFGVSLLISGSTNYTRECFSCGYKETYKLPSLKKRVVYVDQFVISNLVKLLDTSHKSHTIIKADPFWSELFMKLEAGIKSQAIICVDSFYHRDESLTGSIDFSLMKRLYEHFSDGKTFTPSPYIQNEQIAFHFQHWLSKKPALFDFSPEKIATEQINTWAIGMSITVGGRPKQEEVDELNKRNQFNKKQIEELWEGWARGSNLNFKQRVILEISSLFKSLLKTSTDYKLKQDELVRKASTGEAYTLDMDSVFPPFSNDLFIELEKICRAYGIPEAQIADTVITYFSDTDALLEIPIIKISSIMYAGLARSAYSGKKNPPKSLNDVGFISSYLPYCDAMFVDIESETLIKSLPKDTPKKMRLDDYTGKVFSLRNKQKFLDYLDKVIKDVPKEQIDALKDAVGDDYDKPYLTIIEHEKKKLKL